MGCCSEPVAWAPYARIRCEQPGTFLAKKAHNVFILTLRLCGKPPMTVQLQGDAQELYSLARECKIPKGALSVTVRKFTGQRHNIQPPPQFLTMIKVLDVGKLLHVDTLTSNLGVQTNSFLLARGCCKVTDNDAFNALVDNGRPEAIALVSDLAEVKAKVWLGSGVGKRHLPQVEFFFNAVSHKND